MLILLFMAGFSGLAYEVIWTRVLTLTFGGTVFATSAVLCAFMGGLALGSWLAGKWADRHRRPLLLLAAIQLLLGLAGLGLMPVFSGLTHLYVLTYQALEPGFYALTAIRFVLSVLVLLVPAALIAAVIPIITKLAVSADGRIGQGVALVYGVDTLGGVTGVAMVGFVLLPLAGAGAAVRVAAGFNFAVALMCLLLHLRTEAARQAAEGQSPRSEREPGLSLSPRAVGALIAAFAVSGAAALSYEVLVTKVMVHVLGMHIYAVSTMLLSFLFGLGAGSLLCARLLRRPRPLLAWFAATEAGIGLFGFSLPLQFAWVPVLKALLAAVLRHNPRLLWLIPPPVCFAVLLVPTMLMGATFPLLTAALTPSLRRLGSRVGTLYAVNTLGGVVGVVLTTFVVVPFIGFKAGMIIAGCLNLSVALVALRYSGDISPRIRRAAAVGILIAGTLTAVAAVRYPIERVLLARPMALFGGGQLRFFAEGANGTVAVFRVADPRMGHSDQMAINGNPEGGSDLDSLRAFQLLGNLPFFLHPDRWRPKRALVLAFGMGITLGAVADEDSKPVVCIELVPEVLKATRFFAEHNHNPLDNPKVTVKIEDARNFLLATREKFDVIVLDATHPATGDSWMLYTRECYQLVKRALAPGGIAAQWVPLHTLDPRDYLSIVRTMQSVFPHITLWSPPASTHTVLVATPGPTRLDLAFVRERMKDPRVRRNFLAAQIPNEYALVSNFIAGEQTLAQWIQGAPINTDDLSTVQFSYLRSPFSSPGALLGRIKESPLPFLTGLGTTPTEIAASKERIARTCQAAGMVQEAVSLLQGGQPEKAQTVLREAHELDPTNPDAAFLLGLAPDRLHTRTEQHM